MERNIISLNDLNFYYPYIRLIVEDNLAAIETDVSEAIITNNIKILLAQKMKNITLFKQEIDKLKMLEKDALN